MRKRYILALLCLLFPAMLHAQGIDVQPRTIIDFPNAATLPNASLDVMLRVFPGGGLLTGVNVGLHDRLMLGVSYGGLNIIGEGNPDWYPFAGANLRYRFINEGTVMPGIAVGFDSQGHGAYIDSTKRFERKAPGFFAVASKNYLILDGLSGHFGLNYSMQTGDNDKDLNFFAGVELRFMPELSVVTEIDFAQNDNSSATSTNGVVNFGARYNIKDAVYLEFFLIDIFQNRYENFRRVLRITYFEFFRL